VSRRAWSEVFQAVKETKKKKKKKTTEKPATKTPTQKSYPLKSKEK
jgi:hypothetical protein